MYSKEEVIFNLQNLRKLWEKAGMLEFTEICFLDDITRNIGLTDGESQRVIGFGYFTLDDPADIDGLGCILDVT